MSQENLQLPNSFDAETYLLGSIALDPGVFDRVVDVVKAEDFFYSKNALIFKAMADLHKSNQHIDIATVAEWLKRHEKLNEVGGIDYLAELIDAVPTVILAEEQAKIVRDRSVMRGLVRLSEKTKTLCMLPEGKSVDDIIEYVESEMYQIGDGQSKQNNGFVKVSDTLTGVFDNIAEMHEKGNNIVGLASGFNDLDKMTSGFSPGDLVIVAGRPSMGKTTFAMNIAENVALNSGGKGVAIFSMEMPKEQLIMRMIASSGRLNLNKVRTGSLDCDSDWQKLTMAAATLNTIPLHIDDSPGLSPTEVRSRARRLFKEHDIGLIVVDYLQLMQIQHVAGKQTNRQNEVSEISRALKGIAKELKVPVIALSQLSRNLESRMDKRPIMSDLRESGAIEQDADLILFVYRDEVYNKETPDKGSAEIIIGKQRNGELGTVRLNFIGDQSRFANYDPMNNAYGYGGDWGGGSGGSGSSSGGYSDGYFDNDPGAVPPSGLD